MSRVIHFEIQADSPDRLIRFYEPVFGWVFTKWEWSEDYWHITTGSREDAGINGGLIRRPEPSSAGGPTGFVCTIRVENVQDTLVLVKRKGGTVLQDVFPIPGIGWMAYCSDPEGNVFGIIRYDKAAGASP